MNNRGYFRDTMGVMADNPKNLISTKKLVATSLLAFFIVFGAVSLAFVALAQESGTTTTQEQKQQLQQELNKLQAELDQLQGELNKYSQEAASYERDISILEAQIRQIRLRQQQTQVVIQQTSFAIQTNEEAIEELNIKEDRQKDLLSNIILGLYKLDDTSSIEILLMGETLSDFFNDVARRRNLQDGLKLTLDDVKQIRADIEEEQRQLEEKVEEQSNLLQIQAVQRGQVAEKVDEKEELLDASKSKEYEYRELAQNKQKTIQEVRNQIFRLEGAGVAVTFEEAYGYAKVASQLTGVRPAYLLSVLKQESSWGKNVGLCTLVDAETGMGRGVNTGRLIPRVMKVSRDIQPFLQITSETGRDPYNTRIACWPEIYYQGAPYGYGGGMGPAQFLPSTWMGYRERVSAILGRPADPWLIQDAFIASAVKLADAGAAKKDYNSEWCAALIYYSGRCPGNSINWFYPNNIMERAGEYQRDIDILEGN